MAGFTVDTDAVQGLGQQVTRLGTDLANAGLPAEMSGAEAGSAVVGKALAEFHSHWRSGHASLLDNINSLATAIEQAASAYAQADAKVGQAADGGDTE